MTTSLQTQLIQRLERTFLESFFATFRIKMHGRRRKTALSSRGVGTKKIEPCLNMLEKVFPSPLKPTFSNSSRPRISLTKKHYLNVLLLNRLLLINLFICLTDIVNNKCESITWWWERCSTCKTNKQVKKYLLR